MSTVDGCLGIHEPYADAFYKDTEYVLEDRPSETFEEIQLKLRKGFQGHTMVFIKEMAKHLAERLGDHTYIPEDCNHTFLIRQPIKTIKSFIDASNKAMQITFPDETKRKEAQTKFLSVAAIRSEQSYEFLNKVYEVVTSVYKQKSIVVDADDLQSNPEGTLRAYCREVGLEYQDSMVHWGTITPEQRKIWASVEAIPGLAHFIANSVNGTEFVRSEPKEANIEDVDEQYRVIVEENMPIYEKLRERRIKPLEVEDY